jgi:arylsulfatase A-like enzyme
MAEEGMIFTQFYNGWTACTPSRASLLTGCYAMRVGMHGRVCFPNEPKALDPSEYTMAEMLKDAGYATGIFGKWHLGHLPGYLPPSHGFDEYLGIPYSNDMWPRVRSKYPPLPLVHNKTPVAVVKDGKDMSLLTRVFMDAALDFIRKNRDKPFFAYIPFSAVHGPLFANEKFLARLEGGDDTRMNSHEREKMNYVAQVEEIDAAVGETMALLRELKLGNKTLVLFMSDNGGGNRWSERQPLRGGKGGPPYEGHMRTPFIAWWPGKIPAGKVSKEIGVTVDLLPTFARLCGGTLPERKIDGDDISGLLLDPDNTASPHETVFCEGQGFRKGKWKIVCQWNACRLYDLDADIGEKENLAKKYPERAGELRGEMAQQFKALKREMRPSARMDPCGPLVTVEQAGQLPGVAEWRDKM